MKYSNGVCVCECSTQALPSSTRGTDGDTEVMKRAAAKQLIEKYYYQLTEGCGQENCTNDYCASSADFVHSPLSCNRAALLAIQLAKEKAQLCDPSKPSKVPKNSEEGQGTSSQHLSSGEPAETVGDTLGNNTAGATVHSSIGSHAPWQPSEIKPISGFTSSRPASKTSINRDTSLAKSVPARASLLSINEEKLHEIIEQCDSEKNWSRLIRTIGSVFRDLEALMYSFLKQDDSDVGAMEVDGVILTSVQPTLDLESLRRAYSDLFSIEHQPFQHALINAITYLSQSVEMELRYHQLFERSAHSLNIFLIIFEIPLLDSPEFLEAATPAICKAAGQLPLVGQVQLAKIWAGYDVDAQRRLLACFQQLITVKIVSTHWVSSYNVVDDEGIIGASQVLKILYYACILAGTMDPAEILACERRMNDEADGNLHDLLQGATGHDPKEKSQPKQDPLGKALAVNPLDCRRPSIPFEDFINEPLCDQIEATKTIAYFKAESDGKFTFLQHPFLLTPTVKNLGLYFDNRSRMISERRVSLFQSFVHGAPTMPYLRLRVRRDRIIEDALVELEVVAMDSPGDFKKQLYVEFDGEQGIDEGGVSKEFFQLVVEEIFNPDIGMFTYDEETNNYWFNPTSFENDGQFTLIGIVLGLAIYNNIILDVHFPMVVYRKLLGKMGTVEDLIDSHPTLAHSLQQLVEYEGDVEDAFMLNFRIGFKDVFGNTITQDLKDKGDSIPVTNANRKEFVELYANFLLNKSIEKQFRAFKRGFQMVTDESPLKTLFHPEEVELLVCGSRQLDFDALEAAADYDGGFTVDSTTVRHFWEAVHEMDDEQKSKLLQFTTGSDRAPVGGLAKLKLIIARNGVDSDRLPTSHTCFNVLLLPDYRNKEKLKERLLKAINYAKGFGMI